MKARRSPAGRPGLPFVACLAFALLAAACPPAAAHDPGQPVGPVLPGPFTIRAQVLDPKGRPLAGYPVKLLPVLPGKGVDMDNSFYRIPNRDEHATVTDQNGRFTMTNVLDYAQVAGRVYKIARGKWDERFPYVHVAGTDIVALNKLTTETCELTIRTEPATTLKLSVRDRGGRPFTGSLSVSVAAGKGRRITIPAEFAAGLSYLHVPCGDAQSPGKVVLLKWDSPEEARRQAKAHGQPTEGQGRGLLTYGALGERSVALLPGQTIALEFVLDRLPD
ncbi:MAG: hypothetical protein ACM3RP_09220 [Chitinophagales bacterium]